MLVCELGGVDPEWFILPKSIDSNISKKGGLLVASADLFFFTIVAGSWNY